MARVKRAVGSKKHRKAGAGEGQGLLRQQEPLGAGGQRAGHAQRAVRVPRPPGKKGEFRRLWIQRINAGCRLHDISYSRFIAGLTPPASKSTARCWPTWPSPTRRRSAARDRGREGGALSDAQLHAHFRTHRFNDCGASWGAAVRVTTRVCSSSRASACCRQAVDAGWDGRGSVRRARRASLDRATSPVVHELAPNVIERVASTETPQPVLAIVADARRRRCRAGATFVSSPTASPIPATPGTIIRSAEAAGADAVVLTTGSVDPFNPKVVRASAGSLFRVPVVDGDARRRCARAAAGSAPRRTTATRTPTSTSRRRSRWSSATRPTGSPTMPPVDGWITIPSGPAESLNVAMAATVLRFEVARQREHSARDRERRCAIGDLPVPPGDRSGSRGRRR